MTNLTLILNATYEPIRITNWRRALRYIYLNKAEVVEIYADKINNKINVPSVVRFTYRVKQYRSLHVRFSKKTLFYRDNYM